MLALGSDVGSYGACETHAGNKRSHSAKVWSQTPPTSAFQCWQRKMEERMEHGEIKKRKVETDGKYNERDTERYNSEMNTDDTHSVWMMVWIYHLNISFIASNLWIDLYMDKQVCSWQKLS